MRLAVCSRHWSAGFTTTLYSRTTKLRILIHWQGTSCRNSMSERKHKPNETRTQKRNSQHALGSG
eukprot:2869626-Amphidinium_carterae.1